MTENENLRNGVETMIVYTPLWRTMREKGFTTYTLRAKHKMSSSTLQRLQKNMSVSTNTLDDLCKILDCALSGVAEHVKADEADSAPWRTDGSGGERR